MEVGMTVQVIPHSLSYSGKYSGEIGVIVRINTFTAGQGKLAVKFENHTNRASSYGAFWFDPKELVNYENIIKEKITMFGEYKRAGIKFLDGTNTNTEYQYALYDESVKVGDTVVVKTGHHGFALAKVATISDEGLDLIKCGREIVSAVDFTGYTARRQKAERLCQLKAAMDAKVRDLQQVAVYEMFAEKDSSMKELLTEYQSLLSK